MTDVLIVSDELNSYFAGLVLAGRGFRVAIAGRAAGAVHVDHFGQRRTVELFDEADLDGQTRVAMVAAEGEDVEAGVDRALTAGPADLLVVVGGGTAGIVDIHRVARRTGINPAKVLVVSAFVWGGVAGDPVVLNSEKLGLLGGYLAQPSSATAELAAQVVPTVEIIDIVAVGLASLNAIVHPVPMVLGATEIERGLESRFFIDTFGACVSDVVGLLDTERLALGRALGHQLPSFEAMLDTYYANEGIAGSDVRQRVNTFRAYQKQIIPHTFSHRYLTHEVAANLAPMARLGTLVGVDTPVMDALVLLGTVLSGSNLTSTAAETAAEFLALARGTHDSTTNHRAQSSPEVRT